VPVLLPGHGFAGRSPELGPAGRPESPGYQATAIARWDVVPFQTFDDSLAVGVLAFHISGINRVEFSMEGGPWTPVTRMTRNPQTDVWDHEIQQPDLATGE
jgi:hypothetical protein